MKYLIVALLLQLDNSCRLDEEIEFTQLYMYQRMRGWMLCMYCIYDVSR